MYSYGMSSEKSPNSNEREVNVDLDSYGSAPEEWKEFFRAFEASKNNVLAKIFSLSKEKQGEFLKRIHIQEEASFSSVEDPRKYVAYHKSVGGSIGPISAPHLDFEGEYSLLKFYEDLRNEIS